MVLKLVQLDSEPAISEFLKKGGTLMFMYGPKCPPCQRLKPKLFEELALSPTLITMGFINAQAHRELREPYGATFIPFLIVFGDKSDSSSESESDLPVSPQTCRKIKATLQNSDMDVVRPFLNEHLSLALPGDEFDDEVEF